ncbi:hypothetical protein KAX02_02060 [candidate division WOR-3 bacterium]|nr:hypothetical protein [candidate division WOR-3 bacterium]
MALHFNLLTEKDMKQMDALKESYGGASEIMKTIENKRKYETRKRIANEKGFGETLDKTEEYAKSIAKVEDFIEKENIRVTKDGIVTTQVSGWQGAPVALSCMRRMAEDGTTLAPKEMISVMALTEDYVYNGELITTLAITENIYGSKFCSANLIGTPLSNESYARLEKITGERFETVESSPGMRSLVLKNQGTFFGNFGGIEVANNNHLVYLDGITRAAVNTGTNFFLNPSWSTIVAGCYYARDIKNMEFKISMLLSTQNAIQLRMLLNIMKEYIRDDGTSALYEINLGNAMSPEMFIQCARELRASGIPYVSISAHLRINPDLGIENFNWTENTYNVLDAGVDMTIKYESDGTSRPLDTMATYFLSKEERLKQAEEIGEVLYYKSVRCSNDVKEMMRRGHKAIFGKLSYKN